MRKVLGKFCVINTPKREGLIRFSLRHMEGDDPPEQSTTPTAADTPAFCTRLSTEEAVAASREATAIELAKLAQLLDKAEVRQILR